MPRIEEAPDYICPGCGWQGNEEDAIHCECGRLLCSRRLKSTTPLGKSWSKVCGEKLMTIEAYREAEAENARDAELEERRLNYDK